jgi:hypothetical protein
MTNVFQGLEGDDVAYHLSLIGKDINNIQEDVLFIPLNNHYGLHNKTYIPDTIKKAESYRAVIFYDLVNSGDWEHIRFSNFIMQFPHPNKHYLTVNQSGFQLKDIKMIPWDFMWNRFKAYYTEQVPTDKYLHHWAGANSYTLPDLTLNYSKKKKFMSLCGREYGYRTHLYDAVKDLDGYISNRSKEIFLEGKDIVGAFVPIPNNFYTDSCLSIYVESNCIRPELIHITEKTYDPLVKGHFILPFANPGTITRIRNLGFQLPSFIDYSYDTEQDPKLRFDMVIEEFNKVIGLDLYKLHEEHRDMFLYNQSCLQKIPYDHNITHIFNV